MRWSPSLVVQPLLENAIYHGIEPLPGGGTVTISGERNGDLHHSSIRNPVRPAPGQQRERQPHRARQHPRAPRRSLYGERALMKSDASTREYIVSCASHSSRGVQSGHRPRARLPAQ